MLLYRSLHLNLLKNSHRSFIGQHSIIVYLLYFVNNGRAGTSFFIEKTLLIVLAVFIDVVEGVEPTPVLDTRSISDDSSLVP